MFPQFGATADTLSKASTLMFRIGTDAHLYDDPEDVNIAPLLDSKFDSEKCEALKRLLALIAQGFDVSNFFPQVVKNVASQSLEVKKLVYLYLLHYAEKRPNEALLSINCFQKDLGDTNPLVRACALRTMAGIRLHVIAPLVLVAVGKCARDPSVYVRKCAASALSKLHDLRLEEHTTAIEEIVGILFNDHSPGVVGAAAAAFSSVCPNHYSLIGRSYRKLCEILPDVEEWGQIILIGILLRYIIARHGLTKESIMFTLHQRSHLEMDGSGVSSVFEDNSREVNATFESELANMVSRCYVERPDEYLSRASSTNRISFELNGSQFTSAKNNDDVKILLQCTSPLFWSNNSAVVLAAAGVHWIMAPREDVKRIVQPLLFALRSSHASKYVVLSNIQVFAKTYPSLFAPHFEDFFISSSDSYHIRALKLEILSSTATDSSISLILREFQDYIRDPDRRFAADAVAAIGLCAQRLPKMANTCLDVLLALTRHEVLTCDVGDKNGEAGVLVQAIMSIKLIIKQDPLSHLEVIIQLLRGLDAFKVPETRATIIWMVGEYSTLGDMIPKMLSIVLKYLAQCFTSEALGVKLQILNTNAKVLLCAKRGDAGTFRMIINYVLQLAECDLHYDVRDRARLLKNIVSCNIGTEGLEEDRNCLHKNMFWGHTEASLQEPVNYRVYLPGSLSQIVLHAAPGYDSLPKPCSLLLDEFSYFSNVVQGEKTSGLGAGNSGSYGTDDSEISSGSMELESPSDYSSQRSVTGLSDNEETGSASEEDNHAEPLIQILDAGKAINNQNGVALSDSADVSELMSKGALESWLDGPGFSSSSTTEQSQVRRSSARIAMGELASKVKPKIYTLLDLSNGNGLKVDYSFSSEVSGVSAQLVCVEVLFKNCSSEPMLEIALVDEESIRASDSAAQPSGVTESSLVSRHDVSALVAMEEVASLEPGQTTKRILQAHFHHHLLPLKLALFCNGKKFPVKLRPDIGYFVKPLPMDIEAFMDKESRLPGMFEYVRSCTFIGHVAELDKDKGNGDGLLTKDCFLVICENLALKLLSNANFYLVSVDMPIATNLNDASGLRLRFSSEILSNSIPCLITITVEGKCLEPLNVFVKVNCEETVFGLNLLNRVVNFLVEP
ncbi:Affected trafxn cking 2 isoform 1 [Tripterygium wilfordii]|uniref:AP-3 complex subunit beta n=1 Tax=Tripterygium wilfordii TaxID=458696 RepID=A0A7J7C6W1_TRIWF|nr:AP3-complex subunit beta-A [Tripterygium wilfordii]KAF5729597.1 Affected trafxn cking 2 isoform 1 [Tripterygium wilfordii]